MDALMNILLTYAVPALGVGTVVAALKRIVWLKKQWWFKGIVLPLLPLVLAFVFSWFAYAAEPAAIRVQNAMLIGFLSGWVRDRAVAELKRRKKAKEPRSL